VCGVRGGDSPRDRSGEQSDLEGRQSDDVSEANMLTLKSWAVLFLIDAGLIVVLGAGVYLAARVLR